MRPAIITLVKKEIINSTTNWQLANEILQSSYKELLEQIKFANYPFKTWNEVTEISPQAVRQIEINVSRAINPSIYKFKKKVPTGFRDDSNSYDINFISYDFKINEADFVNNSIVIELSFISDKMTLIDSLENKLLICFGDKTTEIKNEISNPFFLKIDSTILINTYKEI